MTVKKKVVSGMRPTGRLHLGNYWGALKNWLDLQNKYDCLFFVADWHSLTTGYDDTSLVKQNTFDMVTDWLTCGLDPKKCVIFRQSDITEIAELNLLLGMITPLGWLLKCPTYREQLIELQSKRYAGQKLAKTTGKVMQTFAGLQEVTEEKEISALAEFSSFGFLGYPVLMTADIVIHGGELVPVGQDQLAHLEISRDIVRKFESLYGKDILTEPKPLLTESAKIPGTDGRKMSKSYGNTIELAEDPKTLDKKIMQMYTDPNKKREFDKGKPEGCTVFALHKLYNPDYKMRETQCREGKIGCVKCKKELLKLVKPHTENFREKRKSLQDNPKVIENILSDGGRKAKISAKTILSKVRKAMKF